MLLGLTERSLPAKLSALRPAERYRYPFLQIDADLVFVRHQIGRKSLSEARMRPAYRCRIYHEELHHLLSF